MKKKKVLALVLTLSVCLFGCGNVDGKEPVTNGAVVGDVYEENEEIVLNIPQEVQDISQTANLVADHRDMEEIQNCIDENGVLTVPMVLNNGIKHKVTSIGEYFYNNAFNEAAIDTTGKSWFDIEAVKKIVIPDTVTVISDGAFCGLPNLEEVVLPAGLVDMSNCFMDCPKLTKITLPESLESIGVNTFKNTPIKSVAIPGKVHTILYDAFMDCSQLEEVILDGNTARIQNGAFSNTPWMNNLLNTAEDGLVILGDQLVACTTGSSVVTIPENINYISGGAFNRVELNIEELIIKDINLEWGGGVFNTNGIQKVVFDCEAEELPEGILRGCYSLEEVVLPRNLKRIGDSAFQDCYALSAIEFPQDLERIGMYAFQECHALKEAVFPETCEVEMSAFKKCTSLETVTWSSHPGSHYAYMYEGCTSLREVTIPEYITEISWYMFADCKNLEKVVLHDGITLIGHRAFSGCTALENLDLPADLQTIELKGFADCTGLDLTVPVSCKNIGEEAFLNVKHINYSGNDRHAPFGATSMN